MTILNPMKYNIPILKRLIPSIQKRVASITWKNHFKVIKFGGSFFLTDYRNYIDRQIAFYADFENKQIDYFVNRLKGHNWSLFLDIGANIGIYSVIISKYYNIKKIYAFEPVKRNVYQINANLLINNIIDRVTIIQKIVSNRVGDVSFIVSPNTATGCSKVGHGDDSVQLSAMCIDSYFENKDQKICLKIDIEGHELNALKGMKNLLENNLCFLQIESWDENEKKVISYLSNLNYSKVHKMGHDSYFANFEV